LYGPALAVSRINTYTTIQTNREKQGQINAHLFEIATVFIAIFGDKSVDLILKGAYIQLSKPEGDLKMTDQRLYVVTLSKSRIVFQSQLMREFRAAAMAEELRHCIHDRLWDEVQLRHEDGDLITSKMA
jgi:hypothetical protein